MVKRHLLILIIILNVLTSKGGNTLCNGCSDYISYCNTIQYINADTVPTTRDIYIEQVNKRVYSRNDTTWIISGICKPLSVVMLTGQQSTSLRITENKNATPLFKVKGSINYDFIYRSYIDTPFAQNDFQQHTVQASLSVTVKDKYPLKLNLSTRVNNSPYFRDAINTGLQFDQYAYLQNAKKKALERLAMNKMNLPDVEMLDDLLQIEIEAYKKMIQMLKGPGHLQKIIESREAKLYNLPGSRVNDFKSRLNNINQKITYKNSTFYDTSSGFSDTTLIIVDNIGKFNQQADSLQALIQNLQRKKDSLSNKYQQTLSTAIQKIYKARNLNELKKAALDYGISDSNENKLDRFLGNIKRIGLGRSVVDYSDLTVSNITLTGINIEYNPAKFYTALGAGKIDYGFRNLFGSNKNVDDQHVGIARIGLGNRDKSGIIFSLFGGKKFSYGRSTLDSVSGFINIAGYSVEAFHNVNPYTSLSVEIAKTTKPLSGNLQLSNGEHNLLNWNDNTNIGLSAKGRFMLPSTQTAAEGMFRRTGEFFQSFSLFTYNTNQTAWLLKIDQPFFKNKVNIKTSLRRNDFTNPFTEKTFSTNTVFKSFQATVRLPKLPIMSLGYHPGSQLYIIDRERIRENVYYIMNASLVHNYRVGGYRMLSSLVYNKFSSKGTDTGFVAYDGINYLASQTFISNKFQVQGVYSFTDQEQMKFYSLDANSELNVAKSIRLGAGIKYNKVIDGNKYIGGRGLIAIDVENFGGFQFQYEKTFLPTIYQTLFPVEVGRVSWFKNF